MSLFTKKVSPKFTLTWDHRQNCPIGQPSTKKWFLGPEMHGPCHKSKEKLGEIRSLLVTLPGTLWVQKIFFLYQSIYGLHLVFYNFFCMTHPNRGGHTRKTGFPDFRIRMNRDGSEKKITYIKSYISYNRHFINFFVRPLLLGAPLVNLGTSRYN